jgi:CheY-like chemotaxis protein
MDRTSPSSVISQSLIGVKLMSHVLIIEDEPFTAFAIELALQDAGATSFDVAATEEDAIAAARANRPDVITSDVKLREGTGPDAVSSIHREVGNVPVIFLTGLPEDCERCDETGTVLSKPFDPRALADAYDKVRPDDPS